MLEDGELAEELVHGLGEEAGQKDERPGSLALFAQALDHFEIVVRTEARLVERIIDHQAPVVVIRAPDDLGRQATNVPEANVTAAHRPPPLDALVLPHVSLRIEPHALEENVAHDLLARAGFVLAACLLEDGLEVDAADIDRYGRVRALRFDANLTERARPLSEALRREARFGSGDGRAERSVIELNDAACCQSLQRCNLWDEGREEKGFHEAIVGPACGFGADGATERRPVRRSKALAARGGAGPMRLMEHRKELVRVEVLGLLETRFHDAVGGVVASREDVEEVADGHDFTDAEVGDVIDENLHQEANRRAVSLERIGEGDQRLDERGTERVKLPKRLRIFLAEERRPGRPRLALKLSERLVERLHRGIVFRSQNALAHDRWEVVIFQGDSLEAALKPVERLPQAFVLGAGEIVADEVGDVALAGDEAHDRDRPRGVLRFDELRRLLHLRVQPTRLRGPRRKPEDELIEEEHDDVEAQAARVARHCREP